LKAAMDLIGDCSLAVFNFYDDARALQLINHRASLVKPWCFWGERPGFYSPVVGRLRRLWLLRSLHRSRAAIWGIGQMAVDAYQSEFGSHRRYVNFPYFSNLERFSIASKLRPPLSDRPRRLLYSGSLIKRKGVDLLASAFSKLVASGVDNLRLSIMGQGPAASQMQRSLSSCQDLVDFVGFKDWNDLPQAYGNADILCAPSRHDGWGLIVPEGLAAGLPVISTVKTGAAFELIHDGYNGWLIPADREDSLLESLQKAASIDNQTLTQMSRSASISVNAMTAQHGASRFLDAVTASTQDWVA